ncbi:hypothetical protein HCUR_00553 [Holospora curviuscula]|uniref:Uncharacterized protein n=1 Tax=Holospora curviuscula TaxID=1082868 RepID=A0A2S5R9M8_9PROT|nr:hypothetical protein HCUR_00553 [Holospora curviuscula]
MSKGSLDYLTHVLLLSIKNLKSEILSIKFFTFGEVYEERINDIVPEILV